MTHYESKALPDAEIQKLVDRLAPLLSERGIQKYSVPALVAAWMAYCRVTGLGVRRYDGRGAEDFIRCAPLYLQPVKEVSK